MLIVGPSMIILLFIFAFILIAKFITVEDHETKVIREEQLYNKDKEEGNYPSKNNRGIISTRKNIGQEEEDRDSGIV